MMSARAKGMALLGSGLLLVAALAWGLLLGETSESARIAKEINKLGYHVLAEDIYAADSWEDSSIRELMPVTDLAAMQGASLAVGFPSDLDRRGHVVLLLANLSDGNVITLFLVDEEIELGFLQIPNSNRIQALAGMDE